MRITGTARRKCSVVAARATQEVAPVASDVATLLAPSSICAVVACIGVGLLAATLVRIVRACRQKCIAAAVVVKRTIDSLAGGRAHVMSAPAALFIAVTILADWTVGV